MDLSCHASKSSLLVSRGLNGSREPEVLKSGLGDFFKTTFGNKKLNGNEYAAFYCASEIIYSH